MKFLLLIIGIAFLYFYLSKRQPKQVKRIPKKPDCDETGCGVDCFCDEATLKRAVKTDVVYFDDEELDAYKGIGADDYTEEQTEQFNEVLTTMQPGEVADWLRSLELRGINLLTALKDEALMLIQDQK